MEIRASVLLFGLLAASGFADLDTAWVRRYDGPVHGQDEAQAVAVDLAGSVYMTGFSMGADATYDFCTVKYDSSGRECWARRLTGTGGGHEWACGVAADGRGGAYVGGSLFNAGTYDDLCLVRYDSSGTEKWVRCYDGPGHGTDMALGIAAHDSGHVYLVGCVSGDDGADLAVVKCSTDGSTEWVALYDGPGESDEQPWAMALDSAGNVFVTGDYIYFISGMGFMDILTVKFLASGSVDWAKTWDYGLLYGDHGSAIALDSCGDVYVCGTSEDSVCHEDFVILKYDEHGVGICRVRETEDFGPVASVVDDEHNLYVAGTCVDSATGPDYALLKYDSAGRQQWTRQYDAGYGLNDCVNAMVLDSAGRILVTGQSIGPLNEYDFLTIAYDRDGNTLWRERYDSPYQLSDYPTAMCMDRRGDVYLAGGSIGEGWGDCLTLKLREVSGIAEVPPGDFERLPGSTIVRGVLELPVAASRKPQAASWLLDISGRKVLELHPGPNDVSRLAPGVYFVRSGPSAASRGPSAVHRVAIAR